MFYTSYKYMYVLHIDLFPPGKHSTLVHALAILQSWDIVLYLIELVLHSYSKDFIRVAERSTLNAES